MKREFTHWSARVWTEGLSMMMKLRVGWTHHNTEQENEMSDKNEETGSCLCGSVRFQVEKISKKVGACHCNMCRKWGGGPLIATNFGSEVLFEGEEYISVFDSSKWAERGFCSQCGSHLFYRMKQSGQHVIPVGLLDTDEGLVFTHQVFIDEKPSFYGFSNETSDMTGAEIFAKFSPPS